MKFIVAQGNPGTEYERTRHNVGFRVLEALAANHDAHFKDTPKFKARIASITIASEQCLLIQPTTYYNETGTTTQAILAFYKADARQDLLVIHDDLSLPFGTVRVRAQGSDAGNNGIKSINAHIGHNYHRVRIGIWNELRDRIADHDFVLSRFSADEEMQLKDALIPKAVELTEQFCAGSLAIESHRL